MTTTAQKFGFLDDPIVNAIEWAQRNTASLIKAALLRFSGPVGALQKLDNSPTEFFEEVLVRASGGVLGAGALALLGAGALPVAAGAIASSGLASLVREELLDILDSNPDTDGLAFSKERQMHKFMSDSEGEVYEVVKPGGEIVSKHPTLDEALEEARMLSDGLEEPYVVVITDKAGKEIIVPFAKKKRFQASAEYRQLFS